MINIKSSVLTHADGTAKRKSRPKIRHFHRTVHGRSRSDDVVKLNDFDGNLFNHMFYEG